jgi:hypothetical protein
MVITSGIPVILRDMLRPVATFWRYVKIQLMVFVFGIVGPIFLIIYFATQPDPSMKWAYWAGLFVTAADILIALALTNASDPNNPANVRTAKRRQSSGNKSTSSGSDPVASSTFSPSTDYSSSDSGSSTSDSGSSSSSD